MITCARCKTVNPPEQKRCKNCGRDLLPGRGFWVRISVLILSLAVGAFGGFVLYRLSQGGDLPDLGCAITSPVFWIFMTVGVPIGGIVYTLQRTPAYEKYVNRAKRHLQIDPEQALEDFNQALNLAPEKQKGTILKDRVKLLATLGRETESARDKIKAMESDGAYDGAAGFASIIGADKDAYVAGIKSSQQKEMIKSHTAVGLGWCRKCKAVVELDEALHCKLHPNTKISEVHLSAPEDVPLERSVLQQQLTKRNQSMRTRRIVLLIALVVVISVLCYFALR